MPLEDNPTHYFFHFPKVNINNMADTWIFKAGETLAFLVFRPALKNAALVKVMVILKTEIKYSLVYGLLR
jgi:hypothetical protein